MPETYRTTRLRIARPSPSRRRERHAVALAGVSAILLNSFISLGPAVGAETSTVSRAERLLGIRQAFIARRNTFDDNTNILVRPGLIADRRRGKILVDGEATGLEGGVTLEFFLVATNSSHGYESLAYSFASPGDIQDALEFIGMTPGRHPDPARLHLWPKGERVTMKFRCGKPAWKGRFLRVEQMMTDVSTQQPMQESGFVFVGSPPSPTNGLTMADIRDPHSIASSYNEPDTVLDIPRIAPQKDVYENFAVNSYYRMPAGTPLQILIEPERRDGTKRVLDMDLRAQARADGPAKLIEDVSFEWSFPDEDAAPEGGSGSATDFLKALERILADGRTPYVRLLLGSNITISAAQQIGWMLAAVDNVNGAHVEGPPPGDILYRAFIPPEAFRDRTERPGAAWELHLRRSPGRRVEGTLTQVSLDWNQDRAAVEAAATDIPLGKPSELRTRLDELGPGLPVILVFTSADITYGELKAFLTASILETHGTIHVFSARP